MIKAWPLGVDMLERRKAKAFYKTHGERLDCFLCAPEMAFVRTSSKPYESLAMILSAKEAVFKTLGASWMGMSGFKHIQILPGKTKFSFRLKGNFKKKFLLKSRLEISFAKSQRYVIAFCHPQGQLPCVGT